MFVMCHITHLTHLRYQLKLMDIVVNLDNLSAFTYTGKGKVATY